ncbi:MAG: ABC transporter permease, partial [Ktedonobacteraceae bacterium]
ISSAKEWERETMKELLLSPASRWSLLTGKMLATFVMNVPGTLLVLLVVIGFIGVHPVHWGEMIWVMALTLFIFVAFGMLLGTLLKRWQAVTALAIGSSIPLFFLSGAFGPISFNTQAIQVLAKIFPVYYAIVLQQHAFHGFDLNTYGVGGNALILVVYALALLVLTTLFLRRSTLAH